MDDLGDTDGVTAGPSDETDENETPRPADGNGSGDRAEQPPLDPPGSAGHWL